MSNDHIEVFAESVSVKNSFIVEEAVAMRDSPFTTPVPFDDVAPPVAMEVVALALTKVSMTASPGFVMLHDVDDLVVQWKRCTDPLHAMQSIVVSLPHLAMRMDKYVTAAICCPEQPSRRHYVQRVSGPHCTLLTDHCAVTWRADRLLCRVCASCRPSYVLIREFMDLNLAAVPPSQPNDDAASTVAISACVCVVDSLASMDARVDGTRRQCSTCSREFSNMFPRVGVRL